MSKADDSPFDIGAAYSLGWFIKKWASSLLRQSGGAAERTNAAVDREPSRARGSVSRSRLKTIGHRIATRRTSPALRS